MSNRLKQITTKAKALYKTGKFAKWTDAIKAASKQTGTTKKKIGAVKKKAAPKKKAAKVSTHKDTKSHNVNIKVVSGLTEFKFYHDLKKEITQRENVLHNVTGKNKKELIQKNGKMWYNNFVKGAKNHIKTQKKLLTQIKKHI